MKFQGFGSLTKDQEDLIKDVFSKNQLEISFLENSLSKDSRKISFDKVSSKYLSERGDKFYNWDLLFSVLGPNDTDGNIEEKLNERIRILKSILNIKSLNIGDEFHGSIRVSDLAESARFYTWLFGVEPKEWTHRYVTFVRPDTRFNFVLITSGMNELNHDTLYHLGMGVSTKYKVVDFYSSALENGFHVEKKPRTTWRGTPLHELWLKDPDGTLIEIYSRLTDEETNNMPEDKEPIFLV